ncbi:MAG: PocR ligand-binding domain-containing protein [Thermodesulfobacteriota bacterium]|nr:PocR ligand-binding domain-containing protein [Thermodesulfobacteriota bacterium]
MAAKPIVDELEKGLSQLKFLDLFDLEEIQKIQDAFAVAAGVASVITYPDGRPITRPGNFSLLCSEVIRKTEKGLADCLHFHSELGRDNPDGPTIEMRETGGILNVSIENVVIDRYEVAVYDDIRVGSEITSHFLGLTATHLEAIPSTRNPQKSAAIPPVSSTRDHSNLHHIETLKC